MPKDWADRAIMFCVIGLVAWAILGLPFFGWLLHSQPASEAAANSGGDQNTQTYRDLLNWIRKDAAGFFTAVLAVIGVFQLAMFFVQLWYIRESLDDAKLAADAAERASKAAQESANISRDTLISTERAFVFLNDVAPDFSVRARGSSVEFGFFVIKPHWSNNGNTPTRNMRIQVHWTEAVGEELPDDFPYSYQNPPAPMFLAPKAAEWSHAISIPTFTATNALFGRCHIFVYGRADYGDIFDDTEPHFTQWCYRLLFLNAQNVTREPPRTQLVAVGPYNGADESKTKRA